MTTSLLLLLACGGAPEEPAPAPGPSPAQRRIEVPKPRTPTPPAEAPPGAQRPPSDRRPNEARGPDCPAGTVLTDRWPGEYPSPVVEVTQAVLLKGRTSPCHERNTGCRLEAGIYHPWATLEQDHGALYQVVRAVEPYEALRDLRMGGQDVPTGTVVEVHNILGEGMCAWWVHGSELVEERCPDQLADRDGLQALEPTDFPQRKLFRGQCRNGKQLWFDVDDTLLGVAGIREGVTLEPGRVGPAE